MQCRLCQVKRRTPIVGTIKGIKIDTRSRSLLLDMLVGGIGGGIMVTSLATYYYFWKYGWDGSEEEEEQQPNVEDVILGTFG